MDILEKVARAMCYERAMPACRCKEKGSCQAPRENLEFHNPIWDQARAALNVIEEELASLIRDSS